MINLNECKFGDRLKMRNGKMAIYVGKEPHCALHFLVMDSIKFGYGMLYGLDNGVMENLTERSYDIVGKWEDEGEYIGQQEIVKANKEECDNDKSE